MIESRQELLQKVLQQLGEETDLEAFFRDCRETTGVAPSYHFGESIRIDGDISDLSLDYAMSKPPRDFFWSTDRTSFAYLGCDEYARFRLEEAGPTGLCHGIELTKLPRYLDLCDISPGFLVVLFAMCGCIRMRIEDADIHLEEGNIILCSPRARYTIFACDTDNISIQIVIRGQALQRYVHHYFEGEGVLSRFLYQSVIHGSGPKYLKIMSKPDDNLKELMLDILVEQEIQRGWSERIIACYFEELLCRLMSDFSTVTSPHHVTMSLDTTAQLIDVYMRDNFTDITIERLSRQFHISPSYVNRMLKRKFGKSYSKMLTEMRMDKAKELLKRRDLSIESISEMVGYGEARQFRRAFGDAFGMSPSTFRKLSNDEVS